MDRYEHKGAAATTTLAGDITAGSTTINISDATGWPDGSVGSFFIIINRTLAGAEKIKIASRTGTSLTVDTGGRGADDTAAAAHSAGAPVEHVLSATEVDELNDHVTDTTNDDHTQYLNSARHAAIAHTTAMLNDEAVTKAKIVESQQLPAGAIMEYGGSTIPTGWLDCNGDLVSRTTYADLFTAIGTTYGAGDGSTTFQLPDARGRTIVGQGTGTSLSARALGATGGEESHTLTTAETPSHSHSFSATSSSSGSHQHPVDGDSGLRYAVSSAGSSMGVSTGYNATGISFSDTDSAGGHTHSVSGTTGTAGGGSEHNNMQPFIVFKILIKT